MKVTLTFKTPDVIDNIDIDTAKFDEGYGETLLDWIAEEKRKVEASLKKWISYGEYITVEFDLSTGKARVLELK